MEKRKKEKENFELNSDFQGSFHVSDGLGQTRLILIMFVLSHA